MVKTWSKIYELLGSKNKNKVFQSYFLENGQVITGENNIANAFNTYFTDITSTMADTIDHSNDSDIHIQDYLRNRPRTTFDFHIISTEELCRATDEIKAKKSSGYDELTTKLIKYITGGFILYII